MFFWIWLKKKLLCHFLVILLSISVQQLYFHVFFAISLHHFYATKKVIVKLMNFRQQLFSGQTSAAQVF